MKISSEIKDRIIGAANMLVAEGFEEPTNAQVLEKMGRGSLSHVSPVMREWRESRKAEISAALEMPSALKSMIDASIGHIWIAASKLASATTDAVRHEMKEAMSAIAAERDEALSEIANLEQHIAALSMLQDELSAQVTLVHQLQSEKAALMSHNAALSIQVSDLKTELALARNDNKALQLELIDIARNKSRD